MDIRDSSRSWRRAALRVLTCALVAVSFAACGGIEAAQDQSGHCNVRREADFGVEGLPCNAGFWVNCTCDSGRVGARLCSADGTRFAGNCMLVETVTSNALQ